jgi:hypothetical protein
MESGLMLARLKFSGGLLETMVISFNHLNNCQFFD